MPFNTADALRLTEILRTAATKEILPCFRRLEAGAVRLKTSAIDLVTDADEAAERAIEADLLRAFPGALVVGEEGVSKNPKRLDGLEDADLAFILDPVDGTFNFVAGLPLFGIMAAVTVCGEVVCGVILDPIVDDWAVALRGEGAWLENASGKRTALKVAVSAPVNELVGNVSWGYLPEDLRRHVPANLWKFANTPDYKCAAHTYRLLASGHLHFGFSSSVKPWDHAAGWLIHREAGGYTAHFDGSPYRPVNLGGGLISAPDQDTWEAVREALLG
jgi:fructose-1,6-bisphosphatase/inositol monophosphatase family enzyme